MPLFKLSLHLLGTRIHCLDGGYGIYHAIIASYLIIKYKRNLNKFYIKYYNQWISGEQRGHMRDVSE